MIRGSPVWERIRPNVAALKLVTGSPQLKVLKRLNVSIRSSSVCRPAMGRSLVIARSTFQNPGPWMLPFLWSPSVPDAGNANAAAVQIGVERLVRRIRVIEHLIDPLVGDAGRRDVGGRRHGQPTARPRVENTRGSPAGGHSAQRGVGKLRRLGPDRDVGDMRAALRAIAAIERRVVGIGVAGTELRERKGRTGVGLAVGHGVVRAQADPAGGAALDRELEAGITLLAHVVVAIYRAEELPDGRVLLNQHAPAIQIGGRGADGIRHTVDARRD